MVKKKKKINSHYDSVTKFVRLPESKRSNSHLEFVFNFLRLPNSKRSQSQVISTVLLILLAITAAGIISAFVINFVKNQLKDTSCIELVDQIKVENNPRYTCFKSDLVETNRKLRVQVHFGDSKDIEGFILEVGVPDGSSKTFDIKEGSKISGVEMFTGVNNPPDPNLKLPGKNKEKTYLVDWSSISSSNPQKSPGLENYDIPINVYPILKGGKTCASGSKQSEIPECYI